MAGRPSTQARLHTCFNYVFDLFTDVSVQKPVRQCHSPVVSSSSEEALVRFQRAVAMSVHAGLSCLKRVRAALIDGQRYVT